MGEEQQPDVEFRAKLTRKLSDEVGKELDAGEDFEIVRVETDD